MAVAVVLVGGCELLSLGGPQRAAGPQPYPGGCADFGFSERRCAAIVRAALTVAELDAADVTAIELVPAPTPAGISLSGGAAVAVVRLHTTARIVDQTIYCGGIGSSYQAACTDTPELRLSTPMDGYHDVPCAGEAPAGCATPLPSIDPQAAVAASPLEVAALDVPIDRLGRYEVDVGQATLPNGILSDASFSVADRRPATFTVTDGVHLAVRTVDHEPLWNAYEHGWRKGVEPVRVLVVFEVDWYEPGAALGLRDVVVR